MKKKKSKNGSNLLKILVLVVVLALVALGGIIVSDLFFPDELSESLPEAVTVTVSGEDIYLNGNEKMNLKELGSYFTERFEQNDYCTVALINDTQNPADFDTYNAVVEMLSQFGLNHQPLTTPATEDELKLASIDPTA